jgi:hypothetical protein
MDNIMALNQNAERKLQKVMKGDKDYVDEYDAVSGIKLKSCHDSQDISSTSSEYNPSNFLSANSNKNS